MSAFVCSNAHISAIVHSAYANIMPIGSFRTPFTLGVMLLAENIASVDARYHETTEQPGSTFVLHTIDEPLFGPAVIQLISSYHYQSCEHTGWKPSMAHLITQTLLQRLRNKHPTGDLLSEQLPWSIDDLHEITVRACTPPKES